MKVHLLHGFDKKGKWGLLCPARVHTLWYPERARQGLYVTCYIDLYTEEMVAVARAGGTVLKVHLPRRWGRLMLYGLCALRSPGARERWFLNRSRRIRALLPPIVRLAFDRWYGP